MSEERRCVRCEMLERERDEVERLKRGIEMYRRAFEEFDAEYCPSDFLSPETLEAMRKWEREDKKRRESGDER